MQKTLTAQERRKNNMVLAVLFAIISIVVILAFGVNLLTVIAFLATPLIMVRLYEETNRQYIDRRPRNQH